jgi:TonB family protein
MKTLESGVLAYLLNSLWEVPLLFACGWLIARLVRRIGVEWEHRVWTATLVLQTVMPACSAAHWSSPWSLWSPWGLWRWFGNNSAPHQPHVSILFGVGERLGSGLHLPNGFAAALVIAYLGICTFFLSRFAWRCRRLALWYADAVPIELSNEAENIWRRCSRQFGIENVWLGASPRLFAPVTLGIRKKLVLLPADMSVQLPDRDLQTVLAHEFAHLRRNDFAKNLFYELLAIPVSYHALFWPTRERMIESREMVCDAIAAGVSGREEYARSLLWLASLLVRGAPIQTPPAIGIFDANTLERRLMRLTQTQIEWRGARRAVTIAACLVLGVSVCASALAFAANVNGIATASGDSPKAKGRQTVPASEMVKYLLHQVPPVYPQEAKEQRIQGKVVLDAIINKDGAVENLVVVSGPKELQQSALDAVRQWKYKPFLLDGEPVEVETTINVIYSLAD